MLDKDEVICVHFSRLSLFRCTFLLSGQLRFSVIQIVLHYVYSSNALRTFLYLWNCSYKICSYSELLHCVFHFYVS